MDDELTPPNPVQIAARMLCRTAVKMRSGVEDGFEENGDDPEAREFYDHLLEWVQGQLAPWLSPSEQEVFGASPGAMSDRDRIDGSWAIENVGVLAWALGFVEMPSYEQPFEVQDVADFIGIGAVPERLASEGVLRPSEEIEALGRTYETIAWRLRCLEDEPESDDSRAYATRLLERAAALGDLPPLVDGDLAIDGKTAAETDPEFRSLVASIAFERLLALNWLQGFDENWDDVPCDTVVSWLWDESQS